MNWPFKITGTVEYFDWSSTLTNEDSEFHSWELFYAWKHVTVRKRLKELQKYE